MRRLSRSHEEHLRASRVIPGGVNSPARAFGGVGGEPIVMTRGRGPLLEDVDGNRYIDYIGSWGPLILGHCHPRVMEAVSKALAEGATFGAPTTLESQLAELVVSAVPSVEMIRMTSSGTEASMTAVRLARGATGRSKIIKFAGCYHGHVDCLLVQAGSSATTLGTPSSPGVPRGVTDDTLIASFNDLVDVERAFSDFPTDIAAIVLEPVVGNMGLVEPRPGFLEGLRDLADRHGALLVFDEVMTGFRLAYGGAQERLGIRPDLSIFGKIIGGGLPVGGVGGKAELMKRLSPTGPVFQAGTLSGNPLAMAAGGATLLELRDDPPYDRLEAMSKRLAEGLDKAANEAGVPHTVARVGSMLTLFFNPHPVRNYADATRSNVAHFSRFFWRLIERGIYWPCSQYEAAFVSAAHTEEHIDQTIEAACSALLEISRGTE